MAKYADISNKNRASLQAKMEYENRTLTTTQRTFFTR